MGTALTEYKQSSANCTVKPAYGTTSVNVDIDNHQLNPNQDDEAYFELECQVDGGAGTCSTAPCQGQDAALTSATASDVAVYCNVRHPEHVESHPCPHLLTSLTTVVDYVIRM
ncbi:hypothetical protein C0Q70_05082 [Pomacea canaliculata]|uniref:Uncharacterized protein n=1 Tax=Pomacea canaliculata TaxID=400727 RepID=A0A2T7PK59_POMCA|nr:hypothetical protein C0Q70_05082 [Pomacea canaliculata]